MLRPADSLAIKRASSLHQTSAMVSKLAAIAFCVLPALLAAQQSQPGTGQCPGGPSLPIQCDPKRPWPQCPPQSYCYARGSVDVGPHYCCPIWSTYGASWRPSAPFYDYVPPMPDDWPPNVKAAAKWPTSAISQFSMSRLQRQVDALPEEVGSAH